MAPIDKSLINKNILKKNEIKWLNNYHKDVFNNLKKFMSKSELLDLKQACSKIQNFIPIDLFNSFNI